MKFDAEEPLEVEGVVYRSIWGYGTEEEIDELLDGVAPEKGWEAHKRDYDGKVLLIKGPAVIESAKPVEASNHGEESEEEWQERTSVFVPEGKVICARCAYVDRKQQMHGLVKCGTARARTDIMRKHSWENPTFPRNCPEYEAAKPVNSDESNGN